MVSIALQIRVVQLRVDRPGAIHDACAIKLSIGEDQRRPSLTGVAANIGRKSTFVKINRATADSLTTVVRPKSTSILVAITAMTPPTEAAIKGTIKEGGATVIIAGAAVKIPPRGEAGCPMHSTVSVANSKASARKNATGNFSDCRNGCLDFVRCGPGALDGAVLRLNRV